MMETIPGLDRYYDPPAGLSNCDCDTCLSCKGKFPTDGWSCEHGEYDAPCKCPRCVECGTLVQKAFIRATQPGLDDVYCPLCFKRVFKWNYRLYWRIEAWLKSWVNRED